MAPHDAPHTLSREGIRNGDLAALLRDAERRGLIRIATDRERRLSLAGILGQAKPGEDIWVFGFGSLMWNPAFDFAERRLATLHGYHRRYCLWTHAGRATAETPGLILALEPGGCCHGEAFRIPRQQAEAELEIIWAREMVAMSYRPCWVTLNSRADPIRAITFASNRQESRYAGRLPVDRIAQTLARAQGPLGSATDYLERTVAHLARLGISDRHLSDLLARMRAGG